MDRDIIFEGMLFLIIIGIVIFVMYGVGNSCQETSNICQDASSSCKTCEDIVDASERLVLYDIDYNKVRVGHYSSYGYYCVWTKGMTPYQIASTDEHEKCHALIGMNEEKYEHFCE